MSSTGRTGGVMMALAAFIGCALAAGSAMAAPTGARKEATRPPAPVVLSAPSSGAPIMVWSRFDGLLHKVVWSRFEGGRWSEPRVLTFGPGDDMAPTVGISSAGSMIYWIDERGRVLYAPFDPETGRLFAVPRFLPVTSMRHRGPVPEGGTDAPVILGNCDKSSSEPCVGPGSPTVSSPPTGASPEGGTDIPIVLTTGSTGTTTLTVASTPTCGTQVVSIASGDMVTVVAVDGSGRVSPLGRLVVDPEVDSAQATTAAGAYFQRRTCR